MMIQQKPTDKEISERWGCDGYNHLSNFSVKIFKGYQLFETKPDRLGDYRHVHFLDPSVKEKIDKDKHYKCWYGYKDAADPMNSSEYFFFAYVEEIPDYIEEAIKGRDIIQEYLNEKC